MYSGTSTATSAWIASGTTTSSSAVATYDGTGSDAVVWYDEQGNRIYGPPPRTLIREVVKSEGVIQEPTGHLEIYLKDGTHIVIDRDQNLRIRDDDAKITYKSNNTREFNRFINASDLLEQFIRDIGARGVRQSEVLDTPIEIFINWLIYKAAKQDGDDPGRLRLTLTPRCKQCGKFIPRILADKGFEFCNPEHARLLFEKVQHDQDQRRLGSGTGYLRLDTDVLAQGDKS